MGFPALRGHGGPNVRMATLCAKNLSAPNAPGMVHPGGAPMSAGRAVRGPPPRRREWPFSPRPGPGAFVEIARALHGPSPSEQADEAELAEDALVVVELGVGGALFLRHRDLRAEPFEGQRAVMREQAQAAGQVAALLPGLGEGEPVALIIDPAQPARAAHGEAPREQRRGPQLHPAAGMAPAFDLRPLAPPPH